MLKKKSLLSAMCALWLAFQCAFATPILAPATYELDGAHSNIGFSVPILGGLSHVRGKFTDFTASIVYDDKDATKSSVTATVKTASIDTGIEARDKHLRTPDFFDAEKYPEITFQSKRIERKGKQLIAYGAFTMHGVAKEIAMPFTITGASVDPKTKKTRLGVLAQVSIDRRDYGITYSRPDNPDFIGNTVELELSLVTKAAGGQP